MKLLIYIAPATEIHGRHLGEVLPLMQVLQRELSARLVKAMQQLLHGLRLHRMRRPNFPLIRLHFSGVTSVACLLKRTSLLQGLQIKTRKTRVASGIVIVWTLSFLCKMVANFHGESGLACLSITAMWFCLPARLRRIPAVPYPQHFLVKPK